MLERSDRFETPDAQASYCRSVRQDAIERAGRNWAPGASSVRDSAGEPISGRYRPASRHSAAYWAAKDKLRAAQLRGMSLEANSRDD